MLKGQNNEQKIWNYLTEKGIKACGVAGLMGNLYAESGLRSDNLQNSAEKKIGMTDEIYTLSVDNGTYGNFIKDKFGYGIAQWTYWNRKQNLYNLAKSRRCSVSDLEMQLDYLWAELNNGYKGVLAGIMNASSVKEASDIVLTQFEKPKDQSDTIKETRASYGLSFYNKYAATKKTTVIIGSARIDEHGKTTGGLVGDQKQTSSPDYSGEVSLQSFYVDNRGWIVIRLLNSDYATSLAESMKRACNNPHIGYNQAQRADILKHGTGSQAFTNCDCSSLIRQCFKEATGIDPGNFTTANEVTALAKTGLVESHAYVSGETLFTGDILVTAKKGHTVAVVEGTSRKPTKSSYAESLDKSIAGAYIVSTEVGALNMRDKAGQDGNVIMSVPRGSIVMNYGYYSTVDGVIWLYVKYNDRVGFMSSQYLRRKES